MKHNTEIVHDEDDREMIIGYNYEKETGYYAENNNPGTWVSETVLTELTSVEIKVLGRWIDILPLLTKKQINYVTNKLTYQ